MLLDLERLGVVSIGGDERAAQDMLRHVGAELAAGIWSETVRIGIAGFGHEETQQLLSLGLMYLLNMVQRAEETLVADAQEYCQEHLLLRLYDPAATESAA